MLFVVIARDKHGHASVRAGNRPDHLGFLKANAGRIRLGGPLLTEDGEGMTGSFLVIEGTSADDVEALLAQDPYGRAGLFESVEITPWKWTVGAPA